MTIRLEDYTGAKKVFDVSAENVVCAILRQVSGDEILILIYQDSVRVCDSSSSRIEDFDDGFVVVCRNGKWDDEFINSHMGDAE